jgi:SNF2 family DNA or RNA helicase
VYLLEPCFDPSVELQAAGRIHRLGQNKEVLCKRFCFRNSVESCIVKVHEKLKSGAFKITDKAFTKAIVKELCDK